MEKILEGYEIVWKIIETAKCFIIAQIEHFWETYRKTYRCLIQFYHVQTRASALQFMIIIFNLVIHHCFYYDFLLGIETLPSLHVYEK